ncbi:dual specificity protein phosphatase 14-like isoform X2 [Mya arenaria]|uniref:dual specificity protein phosphatase 14-like isoform X2 n=1 Tax=Mya arenaria TaxID=6604 RepID=UPI0022E17315|nr:dual specificity protein phosphatase 14-like isoform X2 [Mya arenaria]
MELVFYRRTIPRRRKMDLNMFNQIAQINDHLYLSSAGAIKSDRLRTLGITHVVNCTMEIPNLRIPNLECIQIQVEDTPSARLGAYFDRCSDRIHQVHKGGGKTLVHCVAGVSRSASLCMAYLMKYQRMPLDQAYYHVKKRRPVIRPNVGFWRQMIEFERRLFGRNTVKMIPSGIGPIPEVYKEEAKNMVWFQPRNSQPRNSHLPSQSQSLSQNYTTTYNRSYNTPSNRHGY